MIFILLTSISTCLFIDPGICDKLQKARKSNQRSQTRQATELIYGRTDGRAGERTTNERPMEGGTESFQKHSISYILARFGPSPACFSLFLPTRPFLYLACGPFTLPRWTDWPLGVVLGMATCVRCRIRSKIPLGQSSFPLVFHSALVVSAHDDTFFFFLREREGERAYTDRQGRRPKPSSRIQKVVLG